MSVNNLDLVESRAREITLSPRDAVEIVKIGRRLASDKTYWRDALRMEDDEGGLAGEDGDDDIRPRTIIECSSRGGDSYLVKVKEAVGVLALPDSTIFVNPKIPVDHFHYLMRRSSFFPRLDTAPASLATADTLWDLVAEWFVVALESLIRLGLLTDYSERIEVVSAARGTVRVMETAQLYLHGNLAMDCEFDELSMNSPMNRVLQAAASAVAGTPFLNRTLRRRAMRALARFEDVGHLERSDLMIGVDRRTTSYQPALGLAHHVLSMTGRSIERGSLRSSAFLIPTPTMIEQGVRQVLIDGLPRFDVHKKGRGIPGSKGLTLNPDLVFGATAVGDVKYKVAATSWKRPDLYQLVSFATGYDVQKAALVGFKTTDSTSLPTLQIGQVSIHAILWPAIDSLEPVDAATSVIDQATNWLQ